jgi:hypothetical protein
MLPEAYVATVGTNMDSSIVVLILVWPVHLMAGPLLNVEEIGLMHLYGCLHQARLADSRARNHSRFACLYKLR